METTDSLKKKAVQKALAYSCAVDDFDQAVPYYNAIRCTAGNDSDAKLAAVLELESKIDVIKRLMEQARNAVKAVVEAENVRNAVEA